jgi:hypothetical protein
VGYGPVVSVPSSAEHAFEAVGSHHCPQVGVKLCYGSGEGHSDRVLREQVQPGSQLARVEGSKQGRKDVPSSACKSCRAPLLDLEGTQRMDGTAYNPYTILVGRTPF